MTTTTSAEYQAAYHAGARAVFMGMTSLSGVVPLLAQIRNQTLETRDKADEILEKVDELLRLFGDMER